MWLAPAQRFLFSITPQLTAAFDTSGSNFNRRAFRFHLCCSSGDPLHSQPCTQHGLSPVGRQSDASSVHGLLAVFSQQQGAGGADLLEHVRVICSHRTDV